MRHGSPRIWHMWKMRSPFHFPLSHWQRIMIRWWNMKSCAFSHKKDNFRIWRQLSQGDIEFIRIASQDKTHRVQRRSSWRPWTWWSSAQSALYSQWESPTGAIRSDVLQTTTTDKETQKRRLIPYSCQQGYKAKSRRKQKLKIERYLTIDPLLCMQIK